LVYDAPLQRSCRDALSSRTSVLSLRPHTLESVPEATARGARAALPTGHPSLLLRDTRGTIVQDAACAACCPLEAHPGLPPWRLALVTILPLRDHLAERQAAEAVRARSDGQSRLGLAWTAPGFDCSVLRAWRDRLLASRRADLVLAKLLERCRALGGRTTRGQQRTAATPVLAARRGLPRLALGAETLRAARNAVAPGAPDWLPGRAPGEGYEREGTRIEDGRRPRDQADREA
jgi:transposase